MRVPTHVVYRHFPHETVVLNLRAGMYHGLNRTAGRMLQVIDETGDVAATAAAIAEEFDKPEETVRADLDALCADLEARGILERGPSRGS